MTLVLLELFEMPYEILFFSVSLMTSSHIYHNMQAERNKSEKKFEKMIYLITFFFRFFRLFYSILYADKIIQLNYTQIEPMYRTVISVIKYYYLDLQLVCQQRIRITKIYWFLCNISTVLITLWIITPSMHFALCKDFSTAYLLAVLKTQLSP